MLVFVMAATMAAAADEVPTATTPEKVPYRICRPIIQGYSRSGDVKICRTKTEWKRWEACQGPTRYCSAEQKRQMYGRPTAFAISEDARIVCKTVVPTGSRVANMKVCMPQREWQRQWEEASSSAAAYQNRLRNYTADPRGAETPGR